MSTRSSSLRFLGFKFLTTTVVLAGVTACADDLSEVAERAEAEVLAQVEMASFPRAEEEVNVAYKGPYQFATYTAGLNNRAYNSAIMYYPTDAKPPFAAVAFVPGFITAKEDYTNYLGPMLASHGIAVMLVSPTSNMDMPPARGEDLQVALDVIKGENTRAGSPLQGKVATDRLCISGHSMGGGGTLLAANTLGNRIKCAVPLQPWQPGGTFPRVAAPTLFVVAQRDALATPSMVLGHYRSIPNTVPKYYVEFANAAHVLSSNMGNNYEGQAHYIVAFYKAYLEDDARYLQILNAPKRSDVSTYQHVP